MKRTEFVNNLELIKDQIIQEINQLSDSMNRTINALKTVSKQYYKCFSLVTLHGQKMIHAQ